MAATVRISQRAARYFVQLATEYGAAAESGFRAELERALSSLKSPKRKASKRASRVAKAREVAAHQDETGAIYEAVAERADGRCEMCLAPFSDFDPPHMDHARGRGKAPQSEKNCWLIHGLSCHRQKHRGDPYWLDRYASHSMNHEHAVEYAWALNQIAKGGARGALSSGRTGGATP